MPRPLSENEKLLLERLIKDGVLTEIDTDEMDSEVVPVTCADGHQAIDATLQRIFHCGKRGLHPAMVHTLTDHGGAMVLSPSFAPYPGHDTRRAMTMRVLDACLNIKKTSIIHLEAHVPCGMADRHHLTIEEQLFHLLDAKLTLIEGSPSISVRMFFQVDWGVGRARPPTKEDLLVFSAMEGTRFAPLVPFLKDRGKRTYFVNREALEELRTATSPFF